MERIRRGRSRDDERVAPGETSVATGGAAPAGWSALQFAGNRAVGNLVAGLGPASVAFPHRAAITTATGYSPPGTAVVDPAACADRGVPAFTDGTVTRFASPTPSMAVAAHEATHQLQHAGHTNDFGVGAERHAHAVAQRTAAGGSARDLIGASGTAVSAGVRDYTEFDEVQQSVTGEWRVGSPALVGDQGRTVTLEGNKHVAYADPALITEANRILEAKKSGVRISAGRSGPSGQAPDGSGWRSTVQVNYQILSDRDDNEAFFADCGRSAREVQGPTGTDTPPRGIYVDSDGIRQVTPANKQPISYLGEILVAAGLGNTPEEAHRAYNSMAAADRTWLDKQYGLNRYAAPGVGEAFTRARDDSVPGAKGFNYHWGGVIMVAGEDRVTFENFTKGAGYDARDAEWFFSTYGPPRKSGQTWHDQWANGVGGVGRGVTMAASTTDDPSAYIPVAAAMSTPSLLLAMQRLQAQGERLAFEAELARRHIVVTVRVRTPHDLFRDDVEVEARHAGRSVTSKQVELGAGGSNTFLVPMAGLAPVDGVIQVVVWDRDLISYDDPISVVGFEEPYTAMEDNIPIDGAEYHTRVEFDR